MNICISEYLYNYLRDLGSIASLFPPESRITQLSAHYPSPAQIASRFTTLHFVLSLQPCAADNACSHQQMKPRSGYQLVLFRGGILHSISLNIKYIVFQIFGNFCAGTPKCYTTRCVLSKRLICSSGSSYKYQFKS